MSPLFPGVPSKPGEFERALNKQGISPIIGVDEAGRGALCGPVVAGAVILHPKRPLNDLNDSKLLSAPQRDLLYQQITSSAVAWGIGEASQQEIDEVNILQATFLAMRRAIQQVLEDYEDSVKLVVVDGNQAIPDLALPQKALVKGDQRSGHVAAASILAKVHRDRCMVELDAEYPGYAMAKHKGYATRVHQEALRTLGLSPIHRRTFCRRFLSCDPEK